MHFCPVGINFKLLSIHLAITKLESIQISRKINIRLLIIILVSMLLLISFTNIKAQEPGTTRSSISSAGLLDSALNTMQQLSVYSGDVDWKRTRDSAYSIAETGDSTEAVYNAIRFAFDQLNDHHGWLVLGGKKYINSKFQADTGRLSADLRLAASRGPRIYSGPTGKQYGYVSIPFFGDQDSAQATVFAQRIQDSLCKTINPGTKGIIIDLRLNAGGNLYPMLAGIANVLGDGVYSYNVDAGGKTVSTNSIRDQTIALPGSGKLRVNNQCRDLSKLPVAIITGPVTASAGEMIAIAFRGRKKSIIIGERTGGYVTANDGRYLPGKGNGIVLAVEYLKDRNSRAYKTNVEPDLAINGGEHFFDHAKDAKIAAAIKWMKIKN